MSVRNFLSGVESTQHYQAALDAGTKHMLMSYLYVTKQPGNILAARKAASPHLRFMIDSGAHTLQLNFDRPPYASWKMKDYEKYLMGYLDWLSKNGKYIYAAIELDIGSNINYVNAKPLDDTFGNTVIEDWRKNYFLPLQAKGMNIMFVWHPPQGHAGFEKMCAELPYVGLPGEMSKQPDFNVFLSVARRYLTKLHGLAATKQADFKDWDWFSIDSTTWKAGEIWGTLPVWDARIQKLRFMSKTDNRAAYRELFEGWGLDADKIINDTDYQMVTRASLRSMAAMEEFYLNAFKNRTFYYQLRLPHPARLISASKTFGSSPDAMRRKWKLFRPQVNFLRHAAETNVSRMAKYVHAIACVQYQTLGLLTPEGRAFLSAYFPEIMQQPVPDTNRLAKEMAILVSPPNEPAKRRENESDYESESNPPKERHPSDTPALEEEGGVPDFLKEEL